MKKKRVTISWSGGKDSALALHKIAKAGMFDVVSLHTVINQETKRVGMHGVREELIQQQAEALGLRLQKIYLETSESHAAYMQVMNSFYQQCADDNIHAVVFGDIFLEDLKAFREKLLEPSGLQSIYPLWKLNTLDLIHDFIHAGFKTLICSANATLFTKEKVGQTIDQSFLNDLSPGIDPCGENGEFHTFVYDGPIFNEPVNIKTGEVVKKTYNYQIVDEAGEAKKVDKAFWFHDLLP